MLFGSDLMNELLAGGSKIPVGIHQNCDVVSMDVEDNYVDFNYRSPQGQVHNKRVWIPTMEKTIAYDGKTVQETFELKCKQEASHIAKHGSLFIPKEVFEKISAPSLKEYALKIKAAITPELSKRKVNLKLIPDQTGQYSTFSKYANPPYIELYEPGVEPTLKFTASELSKMKQTSPDISNMDDDLPF